MTTEADTCRTLITPKLQTAGWENEPYSITEQRTFTDGRIVPIGPDRAQRRTPKRADYILRYRRDFSIAVVEAKSEDEPAGTGMQQAKQYAEMLGLKFAYATNGREILEFDYLAGEERRLDAFPGPEELWERLKNKEGPKEEAAATRLLTPMNLQGGKTPRYYQEIAINRAVQAILKGDRRALLTMATGTGKTYVAFQICWKLWNSRWNKSGDPTRRPRILYLADRDILVDDPKEKDFAPFGDARWKIQNGVANKSREMYFAIYQSIARDERRPGLYREYSPDFFDLILVDECHRGSASDESNWREILEYFQPSFQLGMTATPLREENRDTYRYFGNPIYQYSLRQGIDDGFLAPYRVHRIVTNVDAIGWRPSKDDVDRFGRRIPDAVYGTREFERDVALLKRTEAIAAHLTNYMKSTDRFAKTIVFCVDQEHADEMRRSLANLNPDLVKKFPDFVCRVTADEGQIGRGHLGRFQEPEKSTPAILTTSQLLTTGIDVPTCKNVVIARVIGSMTEFKQIIGRGTRVRDDYGKFFFNIIDYTGSATEKFADPDFDGDPILVEEQQINESGQVAASNVVESEATKSTPTVAPSTSQIVDLPTERRKYYFDGGQVEIVAHMVHELDPDGKQLRVTRYTDYTADKVRTLFRHASEMRVAWAKSDQRTEIIKKLEERGISFEELARTTGNSEADPFDLLCNLAFKTPVKTRKNRADQLRRKHQDFFAGFRPEARQILDELVEKYAEHGVTQLVLPDVLQVPPISKHGNVAEIAEKFGGASKLKAAVADLEALLYA